MPNVMAAQLNIGDALCESSVIPFLVRRRKVWQTTAAGVPRAVTLPRLGSKVNFASGKITKIPSGARDPKMYI